MFSSLDGRTPEGSPEETLNVRVSTGSIVSRYGFENLASPLHSTFEALGFDYLQGYNDSYVSQKEFLLCALVNASRKPYSVNPTTAVATEITNGGTAVSLEDTEHFAFVFGGTAYIVAPSGTVTLYSHEIGTNTSWVTVQNTSYTPAPNDPELTITVAEPSQLFGFTASDTWTYPVTTDSHTSISASYPTGEPGAVLFSGSDNDNGRVGETRFQCVFGASVNWTQSDYIFVKVRAESDINFLSPVSTPFQLRISGTWTNATATKFYLSGREAVYVVYIKGMTLTAVEGVRFFLAYKPTRSTQSPASQPICTVEPIKGGGTYLEATTSGKLLWDTTLDGNGITYGVRYFDGTSLYSSIKQGSITAVQAQGFRPESYTSRVGAIITLSAPEPQSPYTQTQFLRLDESVSPPVWKILSTVTASPWTQRDTKQEYEVPALTTAATGSSPVPAPGFTTQGLKNGFAYKGWVIWLFKGGRTNVRHSEVGNPLSLRDDSAAYDPDDLTQPADYSLADDFADEPVGGVQAGQFAVILGQKAVYSQAGDAPIEMTPCRQIPGSMGCAGPRAFTRFRPGSGEYGVAYMDNAWNVWMVFGNSAYAGDSAVRPVELSADCRGFFKRFLYEEQKGEFSLTDASRVRMYVDETDGSLWVRLGKRAMVYRPQDPVNGFQGWEPYEYAANNPPGESSVSACIGPSATSAAISEVNRSGDLSWSLIGNALQSDDLRASAGSFAAGQDTQVLRVASLIPSPLIPADATLTSIQIYVEDSVSSTAVNALPIVSDKAQVRLSGSDYGSDQSGWAPPTTDTARALAVTLGSITAANVNSGLLGLDLGYKTSITADHNTAGNWNISVSPAPITDGPNGFPVSRTTIFTISATYTGPGSPPPSVNVSVQSDCVLAVDGSLGAGNYPIIISVDNGIGDTDTLNAMSADNPSVTANSTTTLNIPLTAGTGTRQVTLVATSSGTTFDVVGTIDQAVTASFTSWASQTVRVDSVLLKVCYTLNQSIPGQEFGIGWEYFAATPQGRLWGVRTSGHIDSFERDSLGEPIDGENIDGGREMPTGKFQFVLDSEPMRLNHLAVQFTGPTTLGVAAKSERTAFDIRTITGGRSVQFPVTIQGEKITCRLDIPENFSARSLTAWVTPLSRQLRQR